VLAAFGGLYALGALLPFWYLTSPESGAAFFPAAGLTLGALVLTPRRTWPLWLAVVAVTEMAVDLTHGQPADLAFSFALANTLEPLVGALCLLWLVGNRLPDPRRGLFGFMVGAAIIGPLVGAAIGATGSILLGTGTNWFEIAGRWWLGDGLGVVVVGAAILAWSRWTPPEGHAGLPEIAVIVAIAIGVTIVPAVIWQHPLLYAILPVLMWAAFRGGCQAVTAAALGVGFAADWVAVTGRADELMAPASQGEQLVLMQVFLGLTFLAALILAVEVAERRRVERAVLRVETERLAREREVLEVAEQERRRMVRDTHDIVGHGLNVMLLQTGAARRVLDRDRDATRDLLESIERVGRRACEELDVALAASHANRGLSPGRGLSSLPELVVGLRAAGMRIELDESGDGSQIPMLVEWSVYRIVQEALTNVAKHAPEAHAIVAVRTHEGSVSVSVIDDGAGTAPRRVRLEGHGLGSMRERAAALGADIEIGPVGTGGFAVRVHIPARQPRP
jgi:signal transduction histidine kinase